MNSTMARMYVGFFSFCIAVGMDKTVDDGTITATHSNPISHVFPSLIELHEFPIRIYPQKGRHTKQLKKIKPFGVTRRTYKELKKLTICLEEAKQRLEEAKLNLSLQNIENQKNKSKKKKALDKELYGKFYIYTAINQDKKFENPWYCIFRMNMAALTRREIAKQKGLEAQKVSVMLWNQQHLISPEEEKICDTTLKKMVQFLSHDEDEEAFLDIGPYPAHIYLLNKRGKKWQACKREKHTVREPLDDINIQELYGKWPEHETRDSLRQLVIKKIASSVPRQVTLYEKTDSADTSSTSSTTSLTSSETCVSEEVNSEL